MKSIIKAGIAIALLQYLLLTGAVSSFAVLPNTTTSASPVSDLLTTPIPPTPLPNNRATSPSKTTQRRPTAAPQSRQPAKTPTKQASQGVQPAKRAAPTPLPVVDARCIISVHGSRYDVTQFRSIHGGGNIFRCGVDMTATFDSQHSMSTLRQMSRYLVQ